MRVEEARDLGRLSGSVARGLSRTVHGIHTQIGGVTERRIRRWVGPAASPVLLATKAVTDGVYAAVGAGLAGAGIAAGHLAGLRIALRENDSDVAPTDHPHGRHALAIANASHGHWIEERAPSLGIPMAVRVAGRDVAVTGDGLAGAFPDATPALAIFLHGLGESEVVWRYRGVNYPERLRRDLGMTPILLRYNTGRRLVTNGNDLSQLLTRLVAAWPVPVERVVLIGHSMGGLVLHSALSASPPHGWAGLVSDTVTLGTPHDGAALERWVTHAVERLGADSGFRWLTDILDSRSPGIRDLGAAALTEPDSEIHDHGDRIRHHVLAAVASPRLEGRRARLLGDLVVHVDSARGGAESTRRLEVPDDRLVVLPGLTHFGLLGSERVAAQLLTWLGRDAG